MTAALGTGPASTPAELAALLAAALDPQLHPASDDDNDDAAPDASSPEGVVERCVCAVFTRVAAANAPANAPLAASNAIDREALCDVVREEGARKAGLLRAGKQAELEREVAAVAKSALPTLLEERLAGLLATVGSEADGTPAEGAPAPTATSAERLAVVCGYLREVALAGRDSALGAAVSRALSALSEEEDVGALRAGGAQTVAGARALAAQVRGSGEVVLGAEV